MKAALALLSGLAAALLGTALGASMAPTSPARLCIGHVLAFAGRCP